MPRESTAHGPILSRRLVWSGVVPGRSWYGWGMIPSTFGSVDRRRIGSSLGLHLIQEWWTWTYSTRSEPTQMASLITRTRRLALTIGPLVAIALPLAAGHKW